MSKWIIAINDPDRHKANATILWSIEVDGFSSHARSFWNGRLGRWTGILHSASKYSKPKAEMRAMKLVTKDPDLIGIIFVTTEQEAMQHAMEKGYASSPWEGTS